MHTVLSGDGIWKDGLGLGKQLGLFVFVARRKMTQQEFACMTELGKGGCLLGGGMKSFSGKKFLFLQESGFVVEQADTGKLRGVLRNEHGIGAVGIAANRVGWSSEQVVGYHFSVGHLPVHARLDIVDLRDGNVVCVNDVATNVSRQLFLFKEIAYTGNAMLQRNGLHADRTVVVNDGWFFVIDFVKLYGVFHALAEEVYLGLKDVTKSCGSINVKGGCASEQSEGRDESHESEAMVTMQMGDEDVVQMGIFKVAAAQLYLAAFGTVYHEEFFADVEHLRRTKMMRSG